MKLKGSIFGCLILILCLIMAMPALADETAVDYFNAKATSLEELSERSGIPQGDLIEAKEQMGTDEFLILMEEYIARYGNTDVYGRSPGSPGQSMTAAQWTSISSHFRVGRILITSDSTTLGINHGHTAILARADRTVEALGPGR